jgi:hypothetical protein
MVELSFLTWLRGRKKAASATALAVVIATPVTLAVFHQGFPISDVDLMAKDVWVTNGADLLTGRLNMQIEELNGGVSMASRSFDVMQDGNEVFVYDEERASIERVDPAYVSLGQSITVPDGAEVAYGGSTMSILRPSDGALWVVPTDGALQFDPEATEPTIELGDNAHAVVTQGGRVFAASSEEGILYSIEGPGALPQHRASVVIDEFAMTTVGERGVILDLENGVIIKDDGGTIQLPEPAIRVQQPGPERDFVVVATGNSLLRVGFGGSVELLDAEVTTPATSGDGVSAPVVLGSCIHGAWASAERYLGVCDGKGAYVEDIPQSTSGSIIEFRVNRSVIALNNLTNGNVWLVTESMRLVENWEEVTPPQLDEGEEGDEKASQQTFEDTLAERTEQNRAPIARPDDLGVRPGRTTILAVLENDTDPDGDVLTISNISPVSESAGIVQFIDGGRALQFVPAPGASGTVSFRYTVSDGRPGGVAEAQVNVSVRPLEENLPPLATRVSGVAVEVGQTVTYNVLTDWLDPDGDDLLLTGASPTTADIVRFRPDGEITFTHTSSEVGQKIVTLTLSDGRESVEGQLIVDVKPAGQLGPVGVPDFATTFVGTTVEVAPLDNDRSPSGAALTLISVEALDDGITPIADLDRGTVRATVGGAGTYYLKYTLGAGVTTSIGLIRVDVLEDPDKPVPPVAVKDTAYLRPNEPTTLAALINDQSPSGRVIGIQSVDLPEAAEQLSVEILNSTVLRITAPSGMTSAVDFTYTISDGLNSSTAGITVVPVPELTKHQAPIAVDDVIKVRVGDVASISVLANDYHPDGARMVLDTELVQANVGEDGLAFVTGDQVRLQAPSEPGQYAVTYRITDAFNEAAVANVVFTVLDVDDENNQPPLPRPLTARVFQGGSVTIEVPLSGIDPDGDSVVFVSAAGAALGEIVGQSSTAFSYEAYGDSVGTDTFTYQVRDTFGEVATGEIRVGVLPRPETVLPPSAVNDAISIRPGRVASVAVMANDSDPNGYPIEIEPELLEVQEGIAATVEDKAIVIEAGEDEGTFVLRYAISNGKGGEDDAFVTVTVDEDAPPQYPIAIDHVVEVSEIVGAETVEIDVLEGAQNPGGRVADLVVSLDGANADAGEVLGGGIVRVTLGDTRQAIAYRLTNEIDELSAMAFIVVPPYTSDLPPTLKPELLETPPVVGMNQTKEWRISDLLDVPSGREVRIINEETAFAGRSNGDPIVADQFTVRYTPEKDFRGQVSITFEVTDGSSETDQSGSRATIQLPVIVGDPNFEDVAPTFSNSTVSIEAGEAPTTIDLRDASAHPNPAILAQLAYGDLTGASSQIDAGLSGSTLTVSAPFGTPPGASTTLKFTVKYKELTVAGEIEVRVVASTRPLPQAIDDVEPEGRVTTTYTISPLANDFNPFAADGQALKIVSAQFEGANLGASLNSTSSTVTVTSGTTKSGTISVIYAIRDATDTAAREVQGRITIVVASAPEPVTSFTPSRAGSQTVNVVFDPPSSSNGAEIAPYTVQVGSSTRTDCLPGQTCQFTGLTNGTPYSVTVGATNKVGTTWSSAQSITPYGQASPPSSASISASADGSGNVYLTWGATSNSGGGAATYRWRLNGSGGWTPAGGGFSATAHAGVGNSTWFEVQACNDSGVDVLCSTPTPSSNSATPTIPPTWSLQVDASDSCVQDQLTTQRYFPPDCNSPAYWQPRNSTVTVNCYADSATLQVNGNYRFYRLTSNGYFISQHTMLAPYDTSVPVGMPPC